MKPLSRMARFQVLLICLFSIIFSNTILASSPSADSSKQVNTNKPLEPVSLQLKWLHQFQFAGYYAAKIKGFYAEEGLDVTIKPRDTFDNNIQQVIDGASEYGIADSMLMLYQAKQAPVKIIMPIFQHSPQVFVTLKTSGIDSLYKLEGEDIAFYQKDTDGFPLLAALHQNKVTPNLERMVIKSGPEMLLNQEVSAYPAYLSNEPFFFKKRGIEVNIINPMNYGIDLYGDLLFTHSDELENHPERVERFRRASLKGWRYALNNRGEIIDYLLNDLKVPKTREHLEYEAQVIEDAIQASSIPLGSMDEGRLSYIKKLFVEHDLINKNFDLTKGIYKPETHKLILNEREISWIKNHKEVTVAIDNNWAPIEFVNSAGEYDGIAKEYFKYLNSVTGIKFTPKTELTWPDAVHKVKHKEVDMFAAVINTPGREHYVNFTKSYLKFPMVIATQKGENYIKNLNKLNGKTIAVVNNYASHELLEANYPKLNLLLVQSPEEGLEAVNQGLAYGYVDNIAVVGYHINKEGLSNIQITGETPFKADVSMAIRNDWPELHSILQKALNTIDSPTQARLNNPWLQVNYKTEVEWQRLFIILIPVVFILLIILQYNRKLKALNTKLSGSNQALVKAQDSLEETNKRLELLTVTDFLTGAYNRKHIDKVLNEEISRSHRYNNTLSVIIIDLDNFKQVNDQYGHLVGDDVLKTVYKRIKENIRLPDTLGRWGGEEFILICPSTNLEQASKLAEKILKALRKIDFQQGFTQTASIGVACLEKRDSADKLVERADTHMYKAKHLGKDQVNAG